MVGVPMSLSRYLKLALPAEVATLVMFAVSPVFRKMPAGELELRATV
jgi:hypothetical protein